MCITEVWASAPLIMLMRNVGGHVAFFAQGLADGRERGDAARRNLDDRRSRRQKRPPERIGRLVECGDDASRDTVRSAEHAIESNLAREDLVHGLIAVSVVPAGIDNVCVWEVFAQDGTVAGAGGRQQRGCLAVPTRRRYLCARVPS